MKTDKKLLLAGALLCSSSLLLAQPNYNFEQLKREQLGRGLVAVRQDNSQVALSWRYLSADAMDTSFDLYRDSEKIAHIPAGSATFYRDYYTGSASVSYRVQPISAIQSQNKVVGSYTLPAEAPHGYIEIPMDIPQGGVTPAGEAYSYTPNDVSIGDVDGDGNYDYIVKWEPTNAHDNAHDGYTGNVLLDCYKLSGERLWRIDLGHNVRAGAHYTQFMVYDLDGDGKAEVVVKTSDGTTDGTGNVIGEATADYRYPGHETERPTDRINDKYRTKWPINQGRILEGNEYLTLFCGATGKALHTIDYVPARGNLADWGDNRANRSDRFLAAVAYLDGVNPSVVMCRGYYTRSVLAAFDWDGKELKQKWVFDSNNPGCEAYAGQGNHNLRVGDVDGDGCDEIIYGQCTINNDGTGLYSTQMNHGDAIHLTQFSPHLKGLQVWGCHENKKDGTSFRDALTGEVLFQVKSTIDVGRCMAADIDPRNPGLEMWSWESGGLRNVKGEIVAPPTKNLPSNMAVWWDGDLLRELLDKDQISKYDWERETCLPIYKFEGCSWNNGTKATPSLQGDVIGDWREEVLMRTTDNRALRLYVSTIPTEYRFHTFLEDPIYRISIATQNVAYNQPTQPGFYFGPDLIGTFRGYQFSK